MRRIKFVSIIAAYYFASDYYITEIIVHDNRRRKINVVARTKTGEKVMCKVNNYGRILATEPIVSTDINQVLYNIDGDYIDPCYHEHHDNITIDHMIEKEPLRIRWDAWKKYSMSAVLYQSLKDFKW